jgi:hypothetical protein
LFEYWRQEALRVKLGLGDQFRFTEWDEDEEVIAVHKTTGHKIRWNGQNWVACN